MQSKHGLHYNNIYISINTGKPCLSGKNKRMNKVMDLPKTIKIIIILLQA